MAMTSESNLATIGRRISREKMKDQARRLLIITPEIIDAIEKKSLRINNVWAKCPPGMFMQGIKRSTKLSSWLSGIEGLICCNPNHSTRISTYDDCYDKDVNVSLNYQGWTMCDADYYLAGFYRGNCKYLSCLDRFKCCKFMPRACGRPLVGPVASRLIRDSSITASSKQTPSAKISEARIGGNDGWSPHTSDKLPYLQFDLEKLYLICGFKVLGCKGSYVNLYRVHVSPEKEYLDSWNIIKPEFYGADAVDKPAYSRSRARKLGRYVRIFPYRHIPDTPFICMQVEIFGEPYIKSLCRFYTCVITTTTIFHYFFFVLSQVVPSRIPWEGELSVDTCVIAANPVKGRKDFLAGRVHKVYEGKNKYAVKYLASKGAVVFKKVVLKREQLQVVYGAWCKIIVRVHLKTGKKPNSRCRGDILQIDAQVTFRSTAVSGLKRFSFDEIKNKDYVSREKVVVEKLKKGKTVLLFEGIDKCLRVGIFLKYYRKTGLLALGAEKHPIKRLYEVHYAKSSTVFDRCGKNEKTCWKSRIPFSGVNRFNCSTSKIWKDNDCRDENECRTGMANCGHLAACQNTLDFYKCVCPKGTVGNGYARKRPCSDVDECKTGNACGEGAVCINTPGSFRCYCKQGFKISGFSRCQDIDECQVPANKKNCEKHKNAFCKNIPGSFQCVCKPGYQGAYKDCKDEDECKSGKHECSPHADCSNTVGSYVCKCKKGFIGGGRLCADLIECDDPSKSGVCHSTLAKCVDFPGGHKCECKVGYHGDGIKNCKLADECELGIHKCHQWATCVNTQKSYDCSCNKGYEGNGFTCKDADECASNQNDCVFNKVSVECVNTNGSYMCACREGFTGDGQTCTNIDECKTGAHNCVENAICTDREGSFSCKCRRGFYGNATDKCIAKSECMKKLSHCDIPDAVCQTKSTNGKKSYHCFCKRGFTGKNSNCIDIDECSSSDQIKCSKYATCINNHGSYECRCKKGFDGDGFNCQDIDECTTKKACSANARCKNTPGSFSCECKQGFERDDPNKNCSDVDECLNGMCKYTGQTCINSLGSFECKCMKGFSQVDYLPGEDMCQDIDECDSLDRPCGSYNYIECVNNLGDYTCLCEYGFNFDKENRFCEDVDECSNEEYPCDEHATCVNNEGEFECVCPEGYVGDGKDYCTAVNSSPSTKAGNVWIFSAIMAVLSRFTRTINPLVL
ncbi:fibrillin-1-like [Acropora millepora]|uniref:fibrillin-1-like n=1 Tax=Acropora millepora TaxID=45264 RepID=UPI001CF459F9|nr:fibrillin-1-like [Acropora millepora]